MMRLLDIFSDNLIADAYLETIDVDAESIGLAYKSFDLIAAEYDEIAGQFDGFPIAAKFGSSHFVEHRPECGKSGKRALDIGCGTGRTLAALSPYFDEVVGIDISPGMLKVANERCRSLSNVSCYELNAVRLEPFLGGFDYVVSHTTLHHFADVSRPLSEIRRVINPGGKIVLVDIIAQGLMKRHAALVRQLVAAIESLRIIKNCGFFDAIKTYQNNTPNAWLKHLNEDRFLARNEMVKSYSRVFPGATFEDRRLEYGLNMLMSVSWENS